MFLFNFGIATEANDYEEQDIKDEVWIKNNEGKLVLMEDYSDASTQN